MGGRYEFGTVTGGIGCFVHADTDEVVFAPGFIIPPRSLLQLLLEAFDDLVDVAVGRLPINTPGIDGRCQRLHDSS